MIEPRIDAYGRYADASALADYLELLALQGATLSTSDVADLIRDNVWTVRAVELFQLPPMVGSAETAGLFPEEEDDSSESDDALEDEATTRATRVFDVLGEREDLLGDRYPFSIGERVATRPAIPAHDPYLALLAITAAHAYNVDTPHDPKTTFEGFVVSALREKGLAAANLARAGGAAANLSEALVSIGADVRLVPTPDAAATRTNAQDEGVDAIGHLCFEDLRAGHWVFIGQATCAKSEEWDRKLGEPSPSQFGPLLGLLIAPQPFLAVPHHVERRHLHWLTRRKGMVLDRIRLSRAREAIGVEEREILEAIRAEQVLAWNE